MAEGYYKDVTRALRAAGYHRISGGKGSHEKWRGPEGVMLIPRNLKSRHTANAIMKDAGIDTRF